MKKSAPFGLCMLMLLLFSTPIAIAQSCVGVAEFVVNINNPPAQPNAITGSSTPCLVSQSYNTNNVIGVTYAWSATGGTITNGQGTSSVTVNWTNAGAQTLTVTPSNGCGNGTLRTLPVTVSTTPAQPDLVTGNNAPCVGNASYSVTLVAGVTYTWSATGGTITNGQGTNSITVNWTNTGAQTLTVTPSNGCGNGTLRTLPVTVSTTPAQPDLVTGNNAPCMGNASYSVTLVAGVTYTWSATGGTITTGQGTNSVTVNWTNTGAQTLTVTPSNGCGNGTARTLSTTVSTTPAQPDLVTGNNAPCIGTASYSVTLVAGVTYTWSATGGTITNGQGSNSVTVTWTNTGAQTLTVTPSNGCGNGTARTLSTTVATTPAQPSAILGNNFACNTDDPSSYSVTNVAGVTYVWSVSGGGTVTPSGNSASVDWTTAGSYILTITPSNTCGDGTARTLNVTVETTPTPIINGVNDVCANEQQTYTVPFTLGNTYLWTVSANGTIISGQGTNSILVEWQNGTTGTVTITETRD